MQMDDINRDRDRPGYQVGPNNVSNVTPIHR